MSPVAGVRMNLRLAGKFLNRRRTVTTVPGGAARGCFDMMRPSSTSRATPPSESAVRVTMVTLETVAMLGTASPRKPRVLMDSRSSAQATLLVENLSKAYSTSAAGMPQPLSATRMYSVPPALISTDTSVAPASMEFSTSSFTTEAGRSTTSPAAILDETSGASSRIGMVRPMLPRPITPQKQPPPRLFRLSRVPRMAYPVAAQGGGHFTL